MNKQLPPEPRTRVFLVLELCVTNPKDAPGSVDLLVSQAGGESVVRHSWPLQAGNLWPSQLEDIVAVAGQRIVDQAVAFVGVQTTLLA